VLIKYKHTDYFVASDEEFLQIKDLSQIYELCINKKGVDGFGGFEMTFALSRIFFQDEEHIPIQISTDLPDVSRIFQYNREFVEKISVFERAEMDSFAYHLREDSLCIKFGFEGMGIWVFLYELHDCCSLAIKEDKNLYLVEENSEYVLER
jgi:hypothetical protein